MPRQPGGGGSHHRSKPLPFPVVFAVLAVTVVFSILVWNVRPHQRQQSPSAAYRAAHGPVIETFPPHSPRLRTPSRVASLATTAAMLTPAPPPSPQPPEMVGREGDAAVVPSKSPDRRGKQAPPPEPQDVIGGGHIAGADSGEGGMGSAKPPPRPPKTAAGDRDVRLALITTLKPCDRDAVFDAQLASVASWAALPLRPSPAVYLLDTEGEGAQGLPRTCSQLIADLVPGVKAIRSKGASSSHGTALLGPMLRLLATMEPDAEVLGLVNGDILLHPASVNAIRAAHRSFDRYFLVGRRASVDLRADGLRQEVMPAVVDARRGTGRHVSSPDPAAAEAEDGDANNRADSADKAAAAAASGTTAGVGSSSDPFDSASWFAHDAFSHVAGDRIDAEDYFLFTRDFFDESALAYPLPSFHVGRPAYDNWLVHTAIHTLQPVIDATGGIQAFHQAHGYGHLKGAGAGHGDAASAGDDGGAENGGGGEHRPVTAAPNKWAYWGSRDQQENYDLALSHGGWRHGLFDFAPLHFVRHGVAKGPQHPDAFDVGVLPAVRATDCLSGVLDSTCLVATLKPGWKPLGNDGGSVARDERVLADMTTYVKELERFVKRRYRQRWLALNKAAKNPFY